MLLFLDSFLFFFGFYTYKKKKKNIFLFIFFINFFFFFFFVFFFFLKGIFVSLFRFNGKCIKKANSVNTSFHVLLIDGLLDKALF